MCDHKLLILLTAVFVNYSLCQSDKTDNLPTPDQPINELRKNNLYAIHINHQNIPNITRHLILNLPKIEKLEIENSRVEQIEENAFIDLKFLQRLSLKHNLLEEIKNNTFNGLPIEELDLSDNRIRTIEEEAFYNMPHLRSIKLDNNRIKVINSRWFAQTPRLCDIHLENNLIQIVPNGIFNNFKVNYCSINFMLSHNQIYKVEENAFMCPSGSLRFNRLYLDHNAIATVPKFVFRRVYVEDLRLDYNRIICTIPEMKTVRHYNVRGNPWNQTCLEAFENEPNGAVSTTRTLGMLFRRLFY